MTSGLVSLERSHLSSGSWVLLHRRRAGLGAKVRLLRSFNQVAWHLFQVNSGMGHDPEVVGPHETAYLMCPLPVQEDLHFVLVQCSSTLAKSCAAIFCHNLGTSTRPWRNTDWMRNCSQRTRNIAFPSTRTSRAGGPQSTIMCVMALHNFCHVPRSRLIVRRLCPSLPNTLQVVPHCHVSTWDSFPPSTQSVFLTSLASAGS